MFLVGQRKSECVAVSYFLFRGETEADWALIADPSCDC